MFSEGETDSTMSSRLFGRLIKCVLPVRISDCKNDVTVCCKTYMTWAFLGIIASFWQKLLPLFSFLLEAPAASTVRLCYGHQCCNFGVVLA